MNKQIWHAIDKAHRETTRFPDHIAAQVGMISAPVGRLMSKALRYKYNKGTAEKQSELREQMKREAIKAAANCLKFIENLK